MIGGVAERLNALVLKTSIPSRVSRVRIPPPPLLFQIRFDAVSKSFRRPYACLHNIIGSRGARIDYGTFCTSMGMNSLAKRLMDDDSA